MARPRKQQIEEIEIAPVYNTIDEATQESTRKRRKTYTPEEREQFKNAMETQGRKAVKLPRINMAFAQDSYDYILTMARASGMTLTKFLDTVIRYHMETHIDIYDKAKEFCEMLDNKQ